MSTKPRLLVPYGLKTLLEGLSRAVVSAQPTNIAHYASFYFTQLLQYREENPSMDFKELVQEFQRRQENAQIQFGHVERLYPLVPKDKAPTEIDIEKEQCPAEEEPCVDVATAEDMPASLNGALKYPLLHRDISNPLVSAHNLYSQLYPRRKTSGPAVGKYKDCLKYQPQEQSSRVEVDSEDIFKESWRLDKVSSKAQSQPTKMLVKKGSDCGTVPKMSNTQAGYPDTRGQDLDRQYSPPRDIPSNGRQTDGVTPSASALIPVRTISKPHNVVNLLGDIERIVSNTSQHPPDQTRSSSPGSDVYLAQQTIKSQLPAPVPPTQEVAQLKIMSGPTENQERSSEKPLSNHYQIHISVDKSVSEVCYEPAYIPGRDASMVHIVTTVPTSRTGPTMFTAETASVHYKATPKPTSHENIQTVVQSRHPSQDPVQYTSVYVPSQTGSNQQCVCQRSSPLQLQQPTYRKTGSSKCYAPCVHKRSSGPEAVKKEGYSDATSQTSVSALNQAFSDSVQQKLMGTPAKNEQPNLWTFHHHEDLRQIDPSVNLPCRTQLPNPSSKYIKFLICPCMNDRLSSNAQPALIQSPPHVVSEAQRVEGSPPYILISSSECKTTDAVQTTMPARFPTTKANTGNPMQDLSSRHDPVYVSVAVPVEQVQGLSDSPSITHLAETRSIPYFAEHGNAIAIAVASTRCPSFIDGLGQKQCSRGKTAQEDEFSNKQPKMEEKMQH